MLKIPVKHHLLTDTPYSEGNKMVFNFVDSDSENLVQDIINGQPTTYLVSGYRGAGKSSFIKKIQEDIGVKTSHAIFIHLNLSRHETKTVILRKLIRRFYLAFESKEISSDFKKAHKLSIEKLFDLYERTFYAVSINSNESKLKKTTWSRSFQSNLNDGIIAAIGLLTSLAILLSPEIKTACNFLFVPAPLAAVLTFFIIKKENTKEFSQTNETGKSVLYDDEIAEHYLVEILTSFSGALKPIFIIDELDKIEDEIDIKNLITELKPVMLSGLATFIIIAGQNLYFRYHQAHGNDDDVFASLFSRATHVPLLKSAEMRSLFNKIIDMKIDVLENTQQDLFRAYVDYLVLKSNKIPRRFISLIRQNIVWEHDKAYLIVEKKIDELLLYSKALSRIEKIEDVDIEAQDYPEPIKDYFSMQLMLKANLIIASTKKEITFQEIMN